MADASAAIIEIELVYALAREQIVETLRVPAGTTVGQAIRLSGVLVRYPEIATGRVALGIFGRRAAQTAMLREFDRIEIYRPLIAEPKQARRARARLTGRAKR